MKPSVYVDDRGRTVYTLSIQRIQWAALFFIIPVLLIFGLPFYLIWGGNVLTALHFRSFIFLLVFIVNGILVHELLHGIVWAIFSKRGFRSIRFGIKWEYLTPYCHCKEPLKVWQYIAGALAPVFFMGLVPAIWAFFNGNTLFMFFGIFYTWTAAGDLIAIWIIRKFSCSQMIYDHPEELGFIIIPDDLPEDKPIDN